MASVVFSLHLKAELKHRLEEAARDEGVSAETMAVRAIETYLDVRAYQRREIAATMAGVRQ